jgi:multidrug efflux pump subunit AcrB
LRFSPLVLAACIVLVVLALTQFARLPKQMFPLSERSQFLLYMNMPDGTDISQTAVLHVATKTIAISFVRYCVNFYHLKRKRSRKNQLWISNGDASDGGVHVWT